MSATTSAAGSILPANDGAAIPTVPPGRCDLALAGHPADPCARSRARRRPVLLARGGARLWIARAAVALGGPATGVALAGTEVSVAQSPAGDLSRGDRGPAVRALQRALHVRSDGVFGRRTERALRAYQRRHGLPVTGRADARTRSALGLDDAATLSPRRIKWMQRRLDVRADGVIGPRTRAALCAFEQDHGLPVDGRPDHKVLAALAQEPRVGDQPLSAPAPAAGVQVAVKAALSKVGSPYSSGATGPSAFDCSGLVTWAMRMAGISVPRTSYAQFGIGARVARAEIQPGDLVFFDTSGPGASDVGMATGARTAVSATTHGVMTHAIFSGYWGSHYVGARRVGA
jgi:cell wall-associated NlpC family hydrolase